MKSIVSEFRRIISFVLCATAVYLSFPAHSADIKWHDKLFEREFFDEDIRVVLIRILQDNDTQVNFRPGVDGRVSFNFRNMPLQAAFNKIVQENNLEYTYDEGTRTVTLSTPLPGRLITLAYAKASQFQSAKARLGLRGDIAVDDANGIVLLRGTPEQVSRLEELAQQLDRAEQARNAEIDKRLQTDTARGTEDAQRRAADAEAREREERAQSRARLRQEVLSTQTKIITVRYANVGPTTQIFQGQTVTTPGLDDTLRTLLGINEAKGGAATASNAHAAAADSIANLAGAAGLSRQDVDELARIRRELGLVPPVISIDPRSNAVIVRGSPTAIADVEQLIARLDRPLPLVEIEVMIVRARRGVAEELGIRWGGAALLTSKGDSYGSAVSTGIDQRNLVAPTNATRQQVPSQITSQTGSGGTSTQINNSTFVSTPVQPLNPLTLLPTALGGSLASFVFRGSDVALQAQINALSQAQKLQTIAAPRVTTLNNLNAKITNDRTQYLAIPPAANAPGGFLEVKAGLILNITPSLIGQEDSIDQGQIRLSINASDKDITLAQGRPTLTGNEVQTQVIIRNGSTFVMGGLMNDTRIEGKDSVPLLSDIPLVGELFKSRNSLSDLEETIFFITPRTVQPNAEFAQDIAQHRYLDGQRAKLAEMRQDVQSRSQLIELNPSFLEEDE